MSAIAGHKTLLSCSLVLPADFRIQDFLAFHRRDPLEIAERVQGSTLQKALVWQGWPACLTVRFDGQRAETDLAIDGPAESSAADGLHDLLQRMLGLTQQVEIFEQTYERHPQLGELIAKQRGLRIPLAATPFEALTWAVTGQQISLKAAVAMRRKLILAAGLRYSGGLVCYPDAAQLAGLAEEDLRHSGFSTTKAQTLLTLSRSIQTQQLPLEQWLAAPPIDEIRAHLLRIRGIGPWTINYALLRGFGWLDGSLHGDAGVRRGLQALLHASEKISAEQAEQWLAQFSPWRALVAAHLWAWQQIKP